MNQCDGCRRGLATDHGLHRDEDGLPVMCCTADRYAEKQQVLQFSTAFLVTSGKYLLDQPAQAYEG